LVRPNNLVLAAFLLIVILAGANALAVRFTVAEMPPFWGATVRFIGAGLLFWALALFRKVPLPTGRALSGVLLYGFLGFGASYAFLYWGFKRVPAGLGSVVLGLVPLLTFFFAFFHRLETFHLRGLLGALLAVAGIALAFLEQPGGDVPLASLLSIVAGAACIAESTVVIKYFPPSDPFMTNALGITAGLLALIVMSVITHEPWNLPMLASTWVSIVYLIILGTVVVFYLFLFIVRRWTASATSYQFVLFPFVTVLLAGWLADEQVNAALLLGGALVLIGVWVGAFSGRPAPAKA